VSQPTPETVSHSLALVVTAGIGSLLLIAQHSAMPYSQAASQAIEVALAPEPSPPEPPPRVPEPPKVARPMAHHEMRQPTAAPLMAAVVSRPSEFSPTQESPENPVVEAIPAASAPSGTIEAQYAATLRSNIDSRTAVPATAEYRLLKPHGEVRVNFILDRSGTVISSDLVRGSGSSLLDHHALEIVRNGRYPPFPETAFQGESRHSFLITLEFHS
jgi:periplasmic protein TonB